MSYDLYLFQPPPGADPLVAAEALLRAMDAEAEPEHEPDPAWEARRTALVDALQRTYPHLTAFGVPPWELNGRDEDGVQIEFFDGLVSVTLPYWHSGRRALEVWTEIWAYLRLLQAEGQLVTYDPQLGQILDLDQDFAVVLDVYEHGLSALRRVIENP